MQIHVTLRQLTSFTLFVAAGGGLLSACSAADHAGEQTLDDPSASAGAEHVGQTAQAINWKEELCKLANQVPSFDVGSFTIDAPTCNFKTYDELYYYGSGGPGDYSKTIAETTYCALADSGNSSAAAVFSTPVGNFGSRSRVRAYGRNNQTRHIDVEHTGSVVLFGLEVPLQYNTTAFDFPSESQPAQTLPAQRDMYNFFVPAPGAPPTYFKSSAPYNQSVPAQTGYYERAQYQNLRSWSIGGRGTIMAGPVPIELKVSLRSNEGLDNYGNGMFAPNGINGSDYAAYVDAYRSCVAICKWRGENFCEVTCGQAPAANQIAGHELLCPGGCTAAYFRNLSDGVLPYSGTGGGARGNILYWDPIDDYIQFGYPGSTTPLARFGEQRYSLVNAPIGRSTAFDFDVTAQYDLNIASIAVGVMLDYYTRAGASLRRYSEIRDAGQAERGHVNMKLDAETYINLNAWMKLRVVLPWPLDPVELHLAYDIIDGATTGNAKSAVKTVGAKSWVISRGGANNANNAACLANATPETTTARPPTTSGWDFVEQVAVSSVDNMHPCNVKICVPSASGSKTGKFTKYDWNAASRKLVPTTTQEACNVCDSTASLCNASGEVVPFATASKSSSCQGTGPICGGGTYCDAPEDCPSARPFCHGGCCGQVK